MKKIKIENKEVFAGEYEVFTAEGHYYCDTENMLFYGTAKEAEQYFDQLAARWSKESGNKYIASWVYPVTKTLSQDNIVEIKPGSFRRMFRYTFGNNSDAYFIDEECVL